MMQHSATTNSLKLTAMIVGALVAIICTVALLWFVVSAVSVMFFDSTIRGTWTIVVPNNYRGTLMVYFGCPGGHSFVRSGKIETYFSSTGIDCVRDNSRSWAGQYAVRRANGAGIPDDPDGILKSGDAFSAGGAGGFPARNGASALHFMDFYVGPARCVTGLLKGETLDKSCHYQDPYAFAVTHRPYA